MTGCKNIHSDWIARNTAAQSSWGHFPAVLLIVQMFCSHLDIQSFSQSSFGLAVPDNITKVKRASAHIKPGVVDIIPDF